MALRPVEFETLSGDLLEEYRESRLPALGEARANAWYVRQVVGFVARASLTWGILLGGLVVARQALDWFVPPVDFHTRAAASTYVALSILLMAGFRASWRSRSWPAGAIAGVVTAGVAALISLFGTAVLLAAWHDPRMLAAVAASGGISEAFTLPLFMVVPGVLLGTIGGGAAAAGRSLHPA